MGHESKDRQLSRREALKIAAAGAAATIGGALAGDLLGGAEARAATGIITIKNPNGKSGTIKAIVDIPGAPDASKNIREIAIDELNIDCREMTTGTDVEYRLYGPGACHWGSASFTSAVTLGASKDLHAWFDECASGKNIRKNISVTLFKSDKSPGRSYTLMDCFPTQWSSVNFDTSSTVQTETIRVHIGRVEFKTT